MLSRANDKLSMENLIIAAGNFNNSEKSNAKTRRSALINFLKQVQLEQQEVRVQRDEALIAVSSVLSVTFALIADAGREL